MAVFAYYQFTTIVSLPPNKIFLSTLLVREWEKRNTTPQLFKIQTFTHTSHVTKTFDLQLSMERGSYNEWSKTLTIELLIRKY